MSRGRLRYVDRAPAEVPWREVHHAADRSEAAVRRAVLDVLRRGVGPEGMAALRRSLLRREPWGLAAERARVVQAEARATQPDPDLTDALARAARAGARVTWRMAPLRDPDATRKAHDDERDRRRRPPPIVPRPVLAIRWDLINPWVARWAERHSARLVTGIVDQRALRAVIVEAARLGLDLGATDGVDEVLWMLDDGGLGLGMLDAPRARAVLRAAETNGWAYDDPRLRALVERKVRSRALTIGRHETMLAANRGRELAWDAAETAGWLDPTLVREWVDADDGRECPICQRLDAEVVPRGQYFADPETGVRYARPPAHVQCRCVVVLVEAATGRDVEALAA